MYGGGYGNNMPGGYGGHSMYGGYGGNMPRGASPAPKPKRYAYY
jgi:hypothetical protein